MTILELQHELQKTAHTLKDLADGDPQRIDLEDLIDQLKIEIIVGSFDVTKDLSAITVVDVKKLKDLTVQLKDAITQEKKTTELVGKIINIAKLALRSTGMLVP